MTPDLGHDLGHDHIVGHVDLWPAVIERLAAWDEDVLSLRRWRKDCCDGLPRGQGTRYQRVHRRLLRMPRQVQFFAGIGCTYFALLLTA